MQSPAREVTQRARDRRQMKQNRQGMRFDARFDEEDGNGGEEHQMFSTEDKFFESNIVFDKPNRSGA